MGVLVSYWKLRSFGQAALLAGKCPRVDLNLGFDVVPDRMRSSWVRQAGKHECLQLPRKQCL